MATHSDWIFSFVFFVFILIFCSNANSSRRRHNVQQQHRTDPRINKYNGWQNNYKEDDMSYDEFFLPEYEGRRHSNHHSKRNTQNVNTNSQHNIRKPPGSNIASQRDNNNAFNKLAAKQTPNAPQNTNAHNPDKKTTPEKPLSVQQPIPNKPLPPSNPATKSPSDGKIFDEKKAMNSIKSSFSALEKKIKEAIASVTIWIKDLKAFHGKQGTTKLKTSPTVKPKVPVKTNTLTPPANNNNKVPVQSNTSPSANNYVQVDPNAANKNKLPEKKPIAPSRGKNVHSNPKHSQSKKKR